MPPCIFFPEAIPAVPHFALWRKLGSHCDSIGIQFTIFLSPGLQRETVLIKGDLNYGVVRMLLPLIVPFCNISNFSALAGYRNKSLILLLHSYYFA